jgi:pyruvate/2-oxoglutarate dehydrogenase complex dihydrolipoamide dehydrogenase (E3) component
MSYDVIVIGAGPAGENVADRAVQGGLTVAVVEKELVGGECSYWACMPSKALLRSGIAMRAAKNVAGASQAVTGTIDAQAVLDRRNQVVSNWSDKGQKSWLDGAGIALLRGHGEITGVNAVKVTQSDGTTSQYTANQAVVVATGTSALIPDIPGLKDVSPWTSREATSAQKVPESLIVVGGGVVACEMATAWATFGSKITLIARHKLLAGVEPFAGEMVGAALQDLGVDVRIDISPTRVSRSGKVKVELSDGSSVEGSEILIATGRTPQTKDLGLESIGMPPGWIIVDETMLVNHDTNKHKPWLYAVGDVNHRALLTHQGKYQGRAAGDVIVARAKGLPLSIQSWGRHVATADLCSIPQVIFTDPEVAAVGFTEASARRHGYNIRVVEYDIGNVSGAYLHSDHYKGRAKAIVDEDEKVLIGVTFVGPDVAELVHAATIAIVGEVPLERLWHAVPSYPTISEIWLRLLEAYGR